MNEQFNCIRDLSKIKEANIQIDEALLNLDDELQKLTDDIRKIEELIVNGRHGTICFHLRNYLTFSESITT